MKWMLYAAVLVAALIAVVATIGALLPKAHVASRRARFRQTPEALFGAVSSMKPSDDVRYELVEVSPPTRMITRIADTSLPYGGSWTFDISGEPGGSSLRITENGEVYNPVFRFVSRFIMGHTGTIDAYLRALGKKLGEPVVIEE